MAAPGSTRGLTVSTPINLFTRTLSVTYCTHVSLSPAKVISMKLCSRLYFLSHVVAMIYMSALICTPLSLWSSLRTNSFPINLYISFISIYDLYLSLLTAFVISKRHDGMYIGVIHQSTWNVITAALRRVKRTIIGVVASLATKRSIVTAKRARRSSVLRV